MAATETDGCADYIGKWRLREPEMAFAEPFCSRGSRRRFQLWGALLLELREAAFELSNLRVIEAKSAWWAEEFARTATLTARHPLTQALMHETRMMLPWPQLGNGLLASAASDPRPLDRDAAIAGMRPMAEAIIAFESALFVGARLDASFAGKIGDAGPDLSNADGSDIDVSKTVVMHLLAERLRAGLRSEDAGRIPLSLLARHRITAAQLVEPAGAATIADWAQQLLTFAPARLTAASVYRRARSAFDRRALQRVAQRRMDMPASPLAALWLAWGAARRRRA